MSFWALVQDVAENVIQTQIARNLQMVVIFASPIWVAVVKVFAKPVEHSQVQDVPGKVIFALVPLTLVVMQPMVQPYVIPMCQPT